MKLLSSKVYVDAAGEGVSRQARFTGLRYMEMVFRDLQLMC